jgi:alkylation response protein AidB-like acyl-CoA dehydrogenase
MSILLAAADTPGMEVTKDLGRLGYKGPETCEVVLERARIPVTELLGGVEGRGMSHAISGLQTGRVNIAARAVGVAHLQAVSPQNSRILSTAT